MIWNLSKYGQIKLSLSVYILIVTISVISNYRDCDAFFPSNILSFVNFINFGDLSSSLMNGYLSFGAIICLILGFSPESILVMPISIIPLTLIGCVLFYRVSKNILLSTVLVGCLYCVNYNPSYVLFWIHTVGNILYITIILLFIIWIDNKIKNKSNITAIFLCISILLISLNFISYNSMAMAVLTIFSLGVILLLVWVRDKYYNLDTTHNISRSQMIVLSIISCVLLLSLNSFYKSFISFTYSMSESGLSSLDKFLISASNFIEDNDISSISPLAPYYLSDNVGIPLIGPLRFIIIGLAILIYSYWLLKIYLGKQDKIHSIDIMLFSVLIGIIMYIFIRIVFVGQLSSFTLITLPALLILARITTLKNKTKLKKIGVLFIIIFIALLLIQVSSISISKIDEPMKLDSYKQISEFGSWVDLYSTKYLSTDVFTYGSICLSSAVKKNQVIAQSISNKYSIFGDDDEILSIYGMDVPPSSRDIIINWYLPQISASVSDWVTLNPWKRYENDIKYNSNYNIVYSSGFIGCLSSYNKW